MADNTILTSAAELAAMNKEHFPNESPNTARPAMPSFPRRYLVPRVRIQVNHLDNDQVSSDDAVERH
jgi:hypothetical protein